MELREMRHHSNLFDKETRYPQSYTVIGGSTSVGMHVRWSPTYLEKLRSPSQSQRCWELNPCKRREPRCVCPGTFQMGSRWPQGQCLDPMTSAQFLAHSPGTLLNQMNGLNATWFSELHIGEPAPCPSQVWDVESCGSAMN